MDEFINVLLIGMMIYCVYKIVDDIILYNKTRLFFLEPDNLKLYNATIRLIKNMAEERRDYDLVEALIEIKDLDEFDSLKKRDREFIVDIIRIIEQDKEELIEFFRWRGDI